MAGIQLKNARRMLLIPEEIYRGFAQPEDGSAKAMVRSKMRRAIDGNDGMNADERAMKYHQEYKRYIKLKKEDEERPLDVKLANLEEMADVVKEKMKNDDDDSNNVKSLVNETPKIRRKIAVPAKRVRRKMKAKASGGNEGERQGENRHSQAMDYIRKNAASLGVDIKSGHILKQSASVSSESSQQQQQLRTSNIHAIVAHLLQNAGVARGALPVGYEEFRRRMSSHPTLKRMFEEQQQGRGLVTFNRNKKTEQKGIFQFKPTLWN